VGQKWKERLSGAISQSTLLIGHLAVSIIAGIPSTPGGRTVFGADRAPVAASTMPDPTAGSLDSQFGRDRGKTLLTMELHSSWR